MAHSLISLLLVLYLYKDSSLKNLPIYRYLTSPVDIHAFLLINVEGNSILNCRSNSFKKSLISRTVLTAAVSFVQQLLWGFPYQIKQACTSNIF